jgi:small subunit ribosomal protein S17
MADEEKQDETTEETPEAVEETPAEETPAEEPAPAKEAVPAEEAPEVLSPKAKRKLDRSAHTGEARPQRSNEERATERVAERKRRADARRRARARTRSRSRERRGPERGQGTPPADREPGTRKVRQGTVISAKPDKTITVRVEITRRHPTYEKVVRNSNTVHAHDERNEAGEGDIVRVVESRPLSKLKRWRLLEVVEKAR